MNTTASGQDANVVQSQLKQALDAALAVAKPAAQPGEQDVRTGNFSLSPRYDQNGKVNGWQGTTELVLDGRDFSRITTTAGKIKSLTLSNVSFGLRTYLIPKKVGWPLFRLFQQFWRICTGPLTSTRTVVLPASNGTADSAMSPLACIAIKRGRGWPPWSLALMLTSRSV